MTRARLGPPRAPGTAGQNAEGALGGPASPGPCSVGTSVDLLQAKLSASIPGHRGHPGHCPPKMCVLMLSSPAREPAQKPLSPESCPASLQKGWEMQQTQGLSVSLRGPGSGLRAQFCGWGRQQSRVAEAMGCVPTKSARATRSGRSSCTLQDLGTPSQGSTAPPGPEAVQHPRPVACATTDSNAGSRRRPCKAKVTTGPVPSLGGRLAPEHAASSQHRRNPS